MVRSALPATTPARQDKQAQAVQTHLLRAEAEPRPEVALLQAPAEARPEDKLVVRAEAVAARPGSSAPTDRPLGLQTFHLVDAMAYAPEFHKGQKMYVRGLLIKTSGEQQLTISAFEPLSPTCD